MGYPSLQGCRESVCVCVLVCVFSCVLSFHQLLYTFDKKVCVSSCSLNKEETLLGEFKPNPAAVSPLPSIYKIFHLFFFSQPSA